MAKNAFVAVVTVSGLFCVHNLSQKESLIFSKDLFTHGYESMKTLGVHQNFSKLGLLTNEYGVSSDQIEWNAVQQALIDASNQHLIVNIITKLKKRTNLIQSSFLFRI